MSHSGRDRQRDVSLPATATDGGERLITITTPSIWQPPATCDAMLELHAEQRST